MFTKTHLFSNESYQIYENQFINGFSLDLSTQKQRPLAVKVEPSSQRIVLCLHGWLDNMASYYPLIADGKWLVEQHIRLITVDFAGHGHSQHRSSAQGYPLLEYVYDLLLLQCS